jgi:rhamnulokinase
MPSTLSTRRRQGRTSKRRGTNLRTPKSTNPATYAETSTSSGGTVPKTYCAIDLGAESGRVVLARFRAGRLETHEVRRFANEPVNYGGSLHWDVARLWLEICRAVADLPEGKLDGIGVDAWGVDYALLDHSGELLENPYHYRDARTNGVMDKLLSAVSKEEIYNATGIQFMPINTLYQLVSAERGAPRVLEAADRLVTIPDLFHYWLSGKAVCEFTNATTTQLVNARTRIWDKALMERVGLPSRLPGPMTEPGTILGPVLPQVAGRRRCPVVLPGSHDTASAVAAVSAREGTAFLSSGTWSLVGMEVDAPVITSESLRLNFTNEGGVNGTTRLLRNVMGLWIVQSCRKSWDARDQNHSYRDLMELAAQAPAFQILFDPDDKSFLNPEDMPAAIDRLCEKTGQPKPRSIGTCVRGTLESLAFKYRVVIQELERLTAKSIDQIRVIGGGSRNRLLNQMTADATGKRVVAGPAEAAVMGNVAVQMMATGAVNSLKEARAVIERSVPTEVYEPRETQAWDSETERFRQYCEMDLCSK